MRKGQKYRIRNRNYKNFMMVMKQLEAKGYDRKESYKMTMNFFDQLEMFPDGISIEEMVDRVMLYNEWIKWLD